MWSLCVFSMSTEKCLPKKKARKGQCKMSFVHDTFQDDKLHVKRLNGGEANVRD